MKTFLFLITLTIYGGHFGEGACTDCDSDQRSACRTYCQENWGTVNFICSVCYGKVECLCAKSSYDLTPSDLNSLCQAVKPGNDYMKNIDECIYMKWEFCTKEDKTNQQPCGYYRQAKCSEGRGHRSKRSLRKED